MKGTLKDINFFEIVQWMHECRKTGRMEISVDAAKAMVIYNAGEVWHIAPRGFRGTTSDELLYELTDLKEGNFLFEAMASLPAIPRTLTVETADYIQRQLLLAKSQHDTPAVAAMKAAVQVLRLKEGAENKVRYVPSNVRKVLKFVDGTRTQEQVLKECQLDEAIAVQIIADLIAQDILEVVEDAPEAETPAEEQAPA